MSGTRVTCTDVETGESETATIENDYIVICDGDRYVDGFQAYPKSGTVVLTIKRRTCSEDRAGRGRAVELTPTDVESIALVAAAAAEVYKPEGVSIWMTASNRLLDGRAPITCIKSGEADRVLDVIDALASGAVL